MQSLQFSTWNTNHTEQNRGQSSKYISNSCWLVREGATQIIKKISGGYLVRPENVNQLLPHHSFITLKQRLDIINGIKKGQGIHINQQKPSLEAF